MAGTSTVRSLGVRARIEVIIRVLECDPLRREFAEMAA
jgi:hypothetical protein